MGYKMVVLDMDGTLLTNDKRITDRNKEALMKAVQMGIKVVISTGRIFTSAMAYGDIIGVDTPIIASNGAYIREKDRDEVVYAMALGEENIREIIRLSHKHNIFCNMLTWDSIYSEKLMFTAMNYTKWNSEMPEDKQVKIRIIDKSKWDEVIEKNKDSILKAVIVHQNTGELNILRQEIAQSLDVEIASSYPDNFEVMNKGVSKGNAVKRLAEYYGISRDEIICMGDNENDLSMIEYAGLGVAMGNGSQDVKDVADFITLSNEEDGVAHVIEKFILNA